VSADRERILSVLKDAVMFSGLESHQLASLAEIASLQQVPEGKLLYNQHTPSKGMYVVAAGQVKIFQLSPEGKEFIVHIVGSGTTFAEAATLGQFDCPASAVAMEPSELVFFPTDKLLALLGSDAEMCVRFLRGMATWLCRLMRTLENIVLRDSLGRVSSYLLGLADGKTEPPVRVRLPIKKRDLASYLALTPETLSRTFARLVELEAIRQEEGNEIELVSLETLRGLAEA